MKYIFTFFLLLLFAFFPRFVFAQKNSFILSGTIQDSKGEALIGASVYDRDSKKGSITDINGSFSINLPAGKHRLVISFVGYNSINKDIFLEKNEVLNLSLESTDLELSEIEIRGETIAEKLETTQMSVERLSQKEAKILPALFGEVDIIKTLQLKPGVKSGNEGSTGMYIRGGGNDQNLILLDDVVIYNPNHLFGFFSIFNSDAVDRVELYKGDFPAQFGGRLSSVIDVKMRSSEAKKLTATGGIGLISSRLTLESPIPIKGDKDRMSFIISGRRTYFDLFTRALNQANTNNDKWTPIPSYYFSDFNGKWNFKINKKNQVYFSGYYGRDVFEVDQAFSARFDWGNLALTGGWKHFFSEKWSVNTAFLVSSYDYLLTNRFDVFSFKVGSNVRDYTLRTDWFWQANPKHSVQMGGMITNRKFEVGRFEGGSTTGEFDINLGNDFYGTEYGLYLNDEWEVSDKLKVNAGVRASGFNQKSTFYWGLEPRISGRYKVSDQVSVKGSFAQMYQYIHLVANSAATLPTDIWYPSNETVKPQRSSQVAGGISIGLFDNQFFLSNEAYYKYMENQVDYKDGAQLFVNNNLDGEFVFGKGWSYGNEIYLEKKTGKLRGWIGYTLSYSWRQFAQINQGEPFHPRYDRRHDASVVLMYELSPRVRISASWVYGTGNAVSLPIGRFFLQGNNNTSPVTVVPEYTSRNGFRMPAYHRLDFGLVWKLKPKRGESDLTFSVYNAYDRRNPFFIYFDAIRQNANDRLPQGFVAKQVSLFPVIPSITYNFKF